MLPFHPWADFAWRLCSHRRSNDRDAVHRLDMMPSVILFAGRLSTLAKQPSSAKACFSSTTSYQKKWRKNVWSNTRKSWSSEDDIGPAIKYPKLVPIEKLTYENFKQRLDKMNPQVGTMSKEQADRALAAFIATVTRIPLRKLQYEMENGGLQDLPSHASSKWRYCKQLYKESEKWWKSRSQWSLSTLGLKLEHNIVKDFIIMRLQLVKNLTSTPALMTGMAPRCTSVVLLSLPPPQIYSSILAHSSRVHVHLMVVYQVDIAFDPIRRQS
jgi:hypothetical protein